MKIIRIFEMDALIYKIAVDLYFCVTGLTWAGKKCNGYFSFLGRVVPLNS